MPPPPPGLGFFTLDTDLPHELNARALAQMLEDHQQKSKLSFQLLT